MKLVSIKQDLRIRAEEALKAALRELSAVKVREIRHDLPDSGSVLGFTASVDIYGRHHTLACEVAPNTQPARLRIALRELCSSIVSTQPDATPVIIAPHLSAEAQALCRENKAGFLDLEGNARLSLGEVFLLKRTLPHAARHSVAHETAQPAAHHTAA